MTVDLDDMLATVRSVLAAHPDGRNLESRNYNDDGSPHCIAGHVYDTLDALPEAMEGSVSDLHDECGFLDDWDPAAIDFLGQVQSYADGGVITYPTGLSWREAFERARADLLADDLL